MGKTKKRNIIIKVSTVMFSNMVREAKEDMEHRDPKVILSAAENFAKGRIEEVVEKYLRKFHSR